MLNRDMMEDALHQLMHEDYTNCCGTTHKDGYMAFYQSRGLYSVQGADSDAVCLVYAGNPFEAIEKICKFRRCNR